ncbi:hypothetical protein OCA08_02055 [Bacillus cereus]|nr:hypothetical protein [Bacillus cereus]
MLSSIVVPISIIFIVGCQEKNNINVQVTKDMSEYKVQSNNWADYRVYADTNELEHSSPIIVCGEFTGKRRVKEWKDSETNEVVQKASESEMKINKIYKGNITSGSTIKIYEPARFENSQFHSMEGYNLVQKNKEYVLFLRPSTEKDTYIIVGMYQGKYDMSNKKEAKEKRTIQKYREIEQEEYFGDETESFNKLKNEVIQKYN